MRIRFRRVNFPSYRNVWILVLNSEFQFRCGTAAYTQHSTQHSTAQQSTAAQHSSTAAYNKPWYPWFNFQIKHGRCKIWNEETNCCNFGKHLIFALIYLLLHIWSYEHWSGSNIQSQKDVFQVEWSNLPIHKYSAVTVSWCRTISGNWGHHCSLRIRKSHEVKEGKLGRAIRLAIETCYKCWIYECLFFTLFDVWMILRSVQ